MKNMEILDELMGDFNNGIPLLSKEYEQVCMMKIVESKGDYELLPLECNDFTFIQLYLLFKDDLSFNSKYYQPNFGAKQIQNEKTVLRLKSQNKGKFNSQNHLDLKEKLIENGVLTELTNPRLEIYKTKLENYALKWEERVIITNHSIKLMQVLCKETRDILKIQKKKGVEEEKNRILWKSRFIYYKLTQLMEINATLFPFEIKLNKKTIFFKLKSIIHILFGHYAQTVSNEVISSKSFHNPDISPFLIHETLNTIFQKIDCSSISSSVNYEINESFNFNLKKIDYQVYFKNIDNDFSISSFYPIETNEERNKLNNYTLINIDQDLSVYEKNS